jgi:hypothetical protein
LGRGLSRDQTENAMHDAPQVAETKRVLDVGNVEVLAKTDADPTIPETIQELLWHPRLLEHENEEQFLKLFESFRAYAEPEDILDYHLVFNATVCKWETARYRFMATAVTANQQLAGLKSLFIQTNDAASIPGVERAVIEQAVVEDSAHDAKRCFTDGKFREAAHIEFESMGSCRCTPIFAKMLLSWLRPVPWRCRTSLQPLRALPLLAGALHMKRDPGCLHEAFLTVELRTRGQ